MNKTNVFFKLRLMMLGYSIAILPFLGSCTTGYSLNCDGENGVLQEAFNDENEEEILASLERGANPNAICTRHISPSLHRAAECGFLQVVEVLLEGGVPVDSKDFGGYTPLHRAARSGQPEVATLLLKRGAQVDSKANGGWTPLHWAADSGQPEVATLLLKRGAQVDSKTNGGDTPLHRAIRDCFRKRSIPTLKLLIEQPQDFHLKNNKDKTALAIAEEGFKLAARENDAPGKKYYSLAIAMLKSKMRP